MIIRLSIVHKRVFVNTNCTRVNEWIFAKLRFIWLFLGGKIYSICSCVLTLAIGVDYLQKRMLSFVTHYMLRNFTYSSRNPQGP